MIMPDQHSTVASDTAQSFYLAKRVVHALVCITVPFILLAIVINWSTHKIAEDIEVQKPAFEVKPLEFHKFDAEAFAESMGIRPE
jgi:hypothetical protein